MSDMGEKGAAPRAPGWIKLLLVASLSVNVAVVGLLAGNAMRDDKDDRSWRSSECEDPELNRRQARILCMVPEARRGEARVILMSRQADYETARERMWAAQQELIDAIRDDPLDPDQLANALAGRRAAAGQMWGIGYEQMAEIARTLSAAERAELAGNLEERTRRWMERSERKAK